MTLPNLALLQRHHATMDTEMKRPASGVVDDPDDPDKRPRADEENARMADAPDAPDAPDADDAIQAQVREAMESMITEVEKPAESYTLSELFLRSVHPPPWSPAHDSHSRGSSCPRTAIRAATLARPRRPPSRASRTSPR